MGPPPSSPAVPPSPRLDKITHEELVARLNVALDSGDADNAVVLAKQIANRRGQMNKKQKVLDCVDSALLVRDTVLDNLNNGLFADMKKSMFKNNPDMLAKTRELLGQWQSRLKLFDHRLMSQIEALDSAKLSDQLDDDQTQAKKRETRSQVSELLDKVKSILGLLNNSQELLDVVTTGIGDNV